MAKKRSPIKVFVEVLQNGEPMDTCTRVYGKKSSITLGSSGTHLCLPLYALPTKIDLLELDKEGVHFTPMPGWNGMMTSSGRVFELSEVSSDMPSLTMVPGDYASLEFRDLRVLIRIGRDHPAGRKKGKEKNPYPGSAIHLVLGDTAAIKMKAVGAVASVATLALSYGILMVLPHKPPKHLEDLTPNYTLSFLAPKHLSNAPEALYKNLDRTQFIRSTIYYYKSFHGMLTGEEVLRPGLMYGNSIQRFDTLHARQEDAIYEKQRDQRVADEKLLSKQGSAVFSLPAVVGEAMPEKINRVMSKIDVLHDALEQSLDRRRKVTEAYRDDIGYDYADYRLDKGTKISKKYLSKIKTTKTLADEERMYATASGLADEATKMQKSIASKRSPTPILSNSSPGPIYLAAGVNYASFLNPNEIRLTDDKVRLIKASTFGTRKKKKIVEPLIGEIDPNLIERAIAKKIFELRLCFNHALRRNKSAQGETLWSWRIDSRGKISDINLERTSIRDNRMITCLKRKIAAWDFPRPRRGSVRVQVPLAFTPPKG